MKIKELPDFRHDWNIMFQEGNLDLLEYVVDVANKFHPYFDGQDISQSEDPIIFNDRYIESTLDLRGRYDRMRSMGWLKDCSWEDFEMNNSNAGILDTSFREKFMDKQLQNTIAAYGLDVSKFWYLILYVNDYVKDTCVGAYKVGTPLIEDLNEMNEKLWSFLVDEYFHARRQTNPNSMGRRHWKLWFSTLPNLTLYVYLAGTDLFP